MIDLFSWLALAFVIGQLWLFGSKKYRIGWWMALAACGAWGVFALATGGWALLVQQVIIAALSVRGLMNLDEKIS